MSTLELTQQNFNATIENNEIVLIDFWASWCGPCQMFAPIFEQAAEQHPDILFAKIDTESEQQLAAMFNIRSIPTLVALREQIVVFSQAGALPGSALDTVIERVQALDMDDIRKDVAARKEQETA
jgi:thioredoxin